MIPAGRYIAVRIIAAMEDGCSPESTIATRAPHHAISIAYRPWVHRDPLVFPSFPPQRRASNARKKAGRGRRCQCK